MAQKLTRRLSRLVALATGVLLLSTSASAQIQLDACDLNANGVHDSNDATLAVNMDIGPTPLCTANIIAVATCNVVVVERVINAVLSGPFTGCVTAANAHTVTLTWTASTTPNVTYNVYRANTTTGGQYVKLNSAPITTLSFTDNTALAGYSYSYDATAVDSSGHESAPSSPAQTSSPVPFP